MKRLDTNGHELFDPRPVAMPSGFKRPETLEEQIRRLVRGSLSRAADNQGHETFEEADDFDVGDDPPDPATPFEEFFDPALGRNLTPAEVLTNDRRYREETEKRFAPPRAAAAESPPNQAAAPAQSPPNQAAEPGPPSTKP